MSKYVFLIRQYAKEHNVELWEIADEMQMSECEFNNKLNHMTSKKEIRKIFRIIDNISTLNK